MSLGKIDKSNGQLLRQSKTDRLPFGRELGEGIKSRVLGFVWQVDQDRDWRLKLGTTRQGNQVIGIRRTLDQDRVGFHFLKHRTTLRADPGP